MTLADALRAVLDDYALSEKRSADVAAIRVRHLLGGLPPDIQLADIVTADLLRYAKGRRGAGAGPATVNRELSILRRAYRLAGVPWYAPPGRTWKMLRESAPRAGFPERAQLDAVLAALPEPEAGAVRFAALTGWRLKSEVCRLRWSQVDFARGEVVLLAGSTKSGEGRVFPLYPQLRELLTVWEGRRGGDYVFHRAGQPIRTMRASWRTACRQAGCPGLMLHDLRRFAARNLIDAGVDEQTAMRLLGHKTPSIFRRYRIVNTDDLRRAAEALGRLLE